MSEFIEDLGKGIQLVCSRTHGFGTDAVLLADFAAPGRCDSCVDLGTGCGIIPFLWLRNGVTGHIAGVDIQPAAIEQFERSRALNGSPANIAGICHDLRAIEEVLPKGKFDLVAMNPPYKREGAGILSDATPDQIARHEVACTVEDACAAAEKLLNFGGRFVMCNRPERLPDVICGMRAHGLEPKRLRMVQKRPETKPWLFLIEGRKGSKPFMEILPPLFIQDENGSDSEELMHILGSYREKGE